MAGLRIVQNVAAVSVVSGTTLTLVQIVAATNQKIRIERIRVSSKGLTTDAPDLIEILRQTTAGTASAGTINKLNDSDGETVQTTSQITFTVEPTAGTIKASAYVNPQGFFDFVFPPGRDLYVKGGDRLGVRANNPGQNGVLDVTIEMEE